MRWLLYLAATLLLAAQQPPKSLHSQVKSVVEGVSIERIEASMRKLESFETRDIHSFTESNTRGAGAAARWLEAEFKSYSPRLEVRLDMHRIPKGGRVVRDLDLANVVAVLPGRVHPGVHVIVSAHYDSMNMRPRAGGGTGFDVEATAAAEKAPGVSDDASGVAAVLELARLMSRQEWPKTVVFIAFSGEEQGLLGSRAYATRAGKEKQTIEAVLNNDIIGTDVAGSGAQAGRVVSLYSGDPMDSPSRSLARYAKEVAERYLPDVRVNTVFREDRFGRGGDHTPFHEQGFAAVRFTTPTEQLEHQHNELDDMAHASPAYTTMVARINAAALSSLALAPRPPETAGLGRGASRYDAALRWRAPGEEPDLAGYSVLVRPTTAPYWEREVFVGRTLEYALKNLSIDDVVVGVRAVGASGVESLVTPYVIMPRFRAPQTAPAK